MARTSEQIQLAHLKWRVDRWTIIASLIAMFIFIPILAVIYLAFFPSENIWAHLWATVLPRYFINSIVMMFGVALIAGCIGVSTAWLVVMKEFPARKLVEWALLLPLAIPAYIGAYAFVDFWEYAGPFQSALREAFDWENAADYWFPEIRGRTTAMLVLAFALYPYIYLLCRVAFREQSASTLEAARALGTNKWDCFWRVGLPLARPAIVAGSLIVMMETLNDFGTVEYFAVQTLTTGIFSVWLDSSNRGGAAQIACIIFVLICTIIVLERYARRNMKTHNLARSSKPVMPERLKGLPAIGALLMCSLPVLIGFVMPFLIMVSHALKTSPDWASPQLLSAMWTSIWVSGLGAAITVGAGLLLIYAVRLTSNKTTRAIMPMTSIGYVAPGAVLGLGIMIFMAAFDHTIANIFEYLFGVQLGLLITGSAAVVIYAYCVRFFALAYGSIDAGFSRISPNIGMAARSLGCRPMQSLQQVHMPLLRGTILTAMLLVFVDCVKELPATLLLRPFGFNTLATHVYDFASLEDIQGASRGALIIILVSICAVIIIARGSQQQNNLNR